MRLPSEIQFHQDIRLLIYRPRGFGETALNSVIRVIEDLEAATQEPFNRFSDTLGTDEVDLNFKYVIRISIHRRLSYAGRTPLKSAILATDSTLVHYARLLALLTQGSSIKGRYSKTVKQPHNGLVSRSNCWRRSHWPRTTLGESIE